MGRKIVINDEELTKPLTGRLGAKIRLSVVRYVQPSTLRANPLNTTYFSAETPEALKLLEDDIAARGILVPLIAKPDGILLAGHNRWQAAQNLGLQDIPVQFVETPLSSEEERGVVVKDNLLRRQLSTQKRIELYKVLYPTFEATFLNEESRVRTGRMKQGAERLTIKRIAEETGQNVSAVKEQLREYRKKASQGTLAPSAIIRDQKQDSDALKASKRAIDTIHKNANNLSSTEREILRRLVKETAMLLE